MTTIFQRAGGASGLLRLAQAWHERALADPVVSHAFEQGYHPEHTARLAAYLGEALGGPSTYSQDTGDESEVIRMHAGNGVHPEMDARALAAWDAALADCGLDADPALRASLHDYFADGIRRMSEHPDSPDTVPDGLTIEVWRTDPT